MADDSFAFINDVKSKAETAISRLESEILSSLSAGVTVDGDITGYDFNKFEFSAPSIPDEDAFAFDASATYETLDGSFRDGYVWQGDNSKAIWSAISTALTSGGIGISSALQRAIFNEDRQRKTQALNDSLLAINAGMGARGFRLPNSMTTGARNEVIQKYQFDLENQSREITKLMEEHARTNWQFCIQQGISTEQYQTDFTKAYNQLFNDVIRVSLDKYKADIEVAVTAYKAKIEGIVTRLQAEKTRADVQAVAWSSMLDKAKTEIEVESADTKAWLEAKAHEVSNRGHAIDGYAHLVGGYAAMASGSSIKVLKGSV